MRKKKINFKGVGICFFCVSFSFLFFSCTHSAPHRELTEQENMVRVIYANQDQTIRLCENCEIVFPIGSYQNINEIKIDAVKHGGNLAQVLYEHKSVYSTSYDVRFFACPCEFSDY